MGESIELCQTWLPGGNTDHELVDGDEYLLAISSNKCWEIHHVVCRMFLDEPMWFEDIHGDTWDDWSWDDVYWYARVDAFDFPDD